MKTSAAKNIDEYLDGVTDDTVRARLAKLRKTIQSAAPGAEEVISYQMPAFKFHGMLVYFSAFKNHIGFYPVSSAIRAFTKELSDYEGSKGTVRFPHDKPIPFDLISRMVKFRVKENLEKEELKKKLKTKRK